LTLATRLTHIESDISRREANVPPNIKPPQSIRDKFRVLGQFAEANNVRSLLGTKLFVDRTTGDFELQKSGVKTWWNRTADDSLTNREVYGRVTEFFVRNRPPRNNVEWLRQYLYAFKGYSTLVRLGYSGAGDKNDALRTQVKTLAALCDSVLDLGPRQPFNQRDMTNLAPPRYKDGICWSLVLDWLRRGFKGKYGYSFANMNVQKKLPGLLALQDDQAAIRTAAISPFLPIQRDVALIDPADANRVAQDQYRTFAGIVYRREVARIYIDPEDRLCNGIGNPESTASMNDANEGQVGKEVINVLRDGLNRGTGGQFGWILSLKFRDFFSDSCGPGHAIGVRPSPNGLTFDVFDPNYGSDEFPVDQAHAWIDLVIMKYSLQYAVESIAINPGSRG